MSSVGSGLAVRTGRFQVVTEETEDSDSTGNYLWLGVRAGICPRIWTFFGHFWPRKLRGRKFGGVRHR